MSLQQTHRHTADPEQQQTVTDRADIHLLSCLKNILQGDIQELFQELAGDEEVCQRIQVNVLADITEVGRIVRSALIHRLQKIAEQDARAEIEE